jgi:7,8-dihydro-6-hydroxymethylpterin-pyrophosphokinase
MFLGLFQALNKPRGVFADGQAEAVGTEHDRSLSVPHKRWQERSFVKAPLADLACGGFCPCPAAALHNPQANACLRARVPLDA